MRKIQLDGLRFFSFVGIFMYHTDLKRFWFGSYASPLFFVLSGFLITGLFIDDFHGEIRLKRFYLRRFFKIIPQYYLAVIAGLIIYAATGAPFERSRVLSYFFLYQNYVLPLPVLTHLWSIAVEEHFYLLYPLLLMLACRLFPDFPRRKNFLIASFIFLIAVANALRASEFILYRYHGLSTLVLAQPTHVRFDGLMFGCLLRFLEPHFRKMFSTDGGRWLPALCFIAGTLIFISFYTEFDPRGWSDYTLLYMAAGFLVVSSLGDFAPMKLFTENRLMRTIGRNSYAIYLWHYLLLFPFVLFYTRSGKNPAVIVIYFFTAILAGIVSTATVERFFLDVRRKVAP